MWSGVPEARFSQNPSAAIVAMSLILLSRSPTLMLMAAFNHKAPCAVKRAGIVDGAGDGSFTIRQSSTILARSCEAGAPAA
jgi:hypothetical protein